MATLKTLILAVMMMMCLFVACAEDLVHADEATQVGSEETTTTSAKKEIVNEPEQVNSEITPEEEKLLAQCAVKHIKSCEQGRLCRQVICPAEAKSEVGLV